ncbi:MAG: sugar-transfer associated ATP-grasp domain-containing protein [Kiloniellaceae bacterium]
MTQKLASAWQFFRDLCRTLPRCWRASRDEGVSVLRQIIEIVVLRLGPGKLTPDDYHLMRVYRRGLSFADKSKYLSNPATGVIGRDRRWGVIADDKLLTYALLSAHGIKVPEIYAISHPSRAFGQRPALKSAAELEEYLLSKGPFPFFSKPIRGSYSKDGMLVGSLDDTRTALLLGDGSSLPLKDYVRHCSERPSGVLIQELLHPHAAIAALVGDRLCTVRMIVLFDDKGPRLHCALWKIAASGNMADNYWRKGNILALLDRETGTVVRCTVGLGAELREVDRHPGTNECLPGFAIPQWDELRELTFRAARALPGLPVQAWDIAPTTKGPMALEVNVFGSLFLPQIAVQSGIYQGEFREFMNAHRK